MRNLKRNKKQTNRRIGLFLYHKIKKEISIELYCSHWIFFDFIAVAVVQAQINFVLNMIKLPYLIHVLLVVVQVLFVVAILE